MTLRPDNRSRLTPRIDPTVNVLRTKEGASSQGVCIPRSQDPKRPAVTVPGPQRQLQRARMALQRQQDVQ